MIESSERLREFLAASESNGEVRCAIDTEADSLHRYSESLCLVQFSNEHEQVLIDPLAIEDMSSLRDYMRERVVWMHGADYDMSMLRQTFDEIPQTVFDTQIGARLLGVRKFGYADLVLHYEGVSLSKTSQKADWAKRPLTPVMAEYALNDVVYLLPMADKITAQLKELGRYDWFLESCEVAREKALNRIVEKVDPWRIKGAGKLQPKGLAYLKALWYWRDAEAADWDRPTFMVCGNKQLLVWVENLLQGKKPELPKHYRSKRVIKFKKAVAAVAEMDAADYPQRLRVQRRKRDDEFEARLEAVLAKRDSVATELDIDPSLLGSRAVLEALCSGEGESDDLLMKWQRELMEL